MTSPFDPSSPPPAAPWSAPPPVPATPRRRGIRKRWVVAAVVVALVGVGGFQVWQREQTYQTGHAAYLAADCAAAVGPLRTVAEAESGSGASDVVLKATAELLECEAVMAADDLGTQGRPGEAVLAYSEFVVKFPRSPLKDLAVTNGRAAITADPDRVATTDVCDALDALEAQQLIATPAETLPPLLYACGQAYEADGEFADALATYAQFRDDYPEHALADDVDAAFARATLAETTTANPGDLPPPNAMGPGGTAGLATIVIQNGSPDELNMVFSGPDVRVEEIEACTDCVKVFGVATDACEREGPMAEYVVSPGTYQVVVKSGSGSSVRPFRGTWTLEAGQEYASCFYIATGL